MFNLFFFATAGLGLLALFAFSPGENLERVERPLSILLFGAILGAFAALALVAAGFGYYPERQVYVADKAEVIDGDTLRMGDVSLRLVGIDAPEFHRTAEDARSQICLDAARAQKPCGDDAYKALTELVANAIVVCRRAARTESFGRVLARCEARRGAARPVDLAQRMAQLGLAATPEEDRVRGIDYARDIEAAKMRGAGVWAGCALKPAAWRGRRDREAFRAGEFEAIAAEDFLDAAKCPAPAPPPAPVQQPSRRPPRSR